MTKQEFKNLKAGDRVRLYLKTVTVKCWLWEDYQVEYDNGQNTKISDPWLESIRLIS
jgi:hypothetical protein